MKIPAESVKPGAYRDVRRILSQGEDLMHTLYYDVLLNGSRTIWVLEEVGAATEARRVHHLARRRTNERAHVSKVIEHARDRAPVF